MSFKFTFKGLKGVFNSFGRRRIEFRALARMNAVISGDQFIQQIRKRWYSGRNSDGTGLNQDTRRLFTEWIARPRQIKGGLAIVIKNSKVYARFHEFPEEGSRLKKRSFVTEDINGEIGRKIFIGGFREALKKAMS